MIDNIASQKLKSSIRLVACIETALGLLNIREIATADPRIDALLFAAEDYCSDTGVTRTASRRELYYPRSVVATTAHAFGLQAIDMVCIAIHDKDVLVDECKEGMEMGFTGKQVIHPGQVDTVQQMFLPSDAALLRAWRIVQGYKDCSASGKGVFDLDGHVIDLPLVRWAEGVLDKASRAGIDVEARFSNIKS
ncbi:hypothetical protein EV182_003221 [Spiromyces aspiralis]|uniref:Uncharacterized protein n=1 Tax=Spiromyces aspiralis TaxID=68401 RepID=A0ACC1HFF4_9FUNG|nr:hypothetical protein EV182_003221 [Spiromyces aspiralis]